MKVKNILAALVIIIVMSTVYLAYYGLFAGVEIQEIKKGPWVFVYEKHVGPYGGAKHVADKIYRTLSKEEKVETLRGIGIFYDKPGDVEEEKLRSVSGCLLEEKDLARVPELEKKYRVGEVPAGSVLLVEFPMKGSLSIIMGAIKVYPKLSVLMKQKKYKPVPMIEIYDPGKSRLYYVAALEAEKGLFESFLR